LPRDSAHKRQLTTAPSRPLPRAVFFTFVPIGTPLPRIEPERTKAFELGADAGLLGGLVEQARAVLGEAVSDYFEYGFSQAARALADVVRLPRRRSGAPGAVAWVLRLDLTY